jgi:DNA-binding response OmpR family regulator
MRSADDAAHGRPGCYARIRLLLVEDELSTVFAMREFFTQAGYDVDCASGLDEARELLAQKLYDAVITDLHLTNHRSGEGMNIAWRARERNPHACIVMLTAYGSEAVENEAKRSGVNLFRTKPVELTPLSAFVMMAVRPDECSAMRRESDTKCRHH